MTALVCCVISAFAGLPSIFHHSHLLAVYHGRTSTEIYQTCRFAGKCQQVKPYLEFVCLVTAVPEQQQPRGVGQTWKGSYNIWGEGERAIYHKDYFWEGGERLAMCSSPAKERSMSWCANIKISWQDKWVGAKNVTIGRECRWLCMNKVNK